jgi:hypothetical protein
MESIMKICKECVYYNLVIDARYVSERHQCRHTSLKQIDLVTGEISFNNNSAYEMRTPESVCRPEGKLWEKKDEFKTAFVI